MDIEAIKAYWDDRAGGDASAQSTTQDVFLREIEARALTDELQHLAPRAILDVGCGDARTTVNLARRYPESQFVGVDYAQSMVINAQSVIARADVSNIRVFQHDITEQLPLTDVDLAYTTRCLINLPTWELQKAAIDHIATAIRSGGHYVMIENFVEGQQAFNELRRAFDLSEIPVRSHNKFFVRNELLDYAARHFNLVKECNISSMYYVVSRVVYSAICQRNNIQPDYFDVHHQLASNLPYAGEYGPVRMLLLQRK